MTASPMAGPQVQGPQAQEPLAQGPQAPGPLPAGMLRIQQGSQERFIWPVHLPGWLAIGWRLAAAPSGGAASAEPQALTAALGGELPEPEAAKPESPRSRRGRRRKDETLAVESAHAGLSAVSDASADPGPDPEPREPVLDPDPDAAATATAAAATAAEVPLLTALPDDLFDEPLI